MRPEVGSLANTPYDCGVPFLIPHRTARGEHHMYLYNDVRCSITMPQSLLGKTKIKGTKNRAGNAICLPYDNNFISSVRLPYPVVGIDFFYTANMSGCKFFVDTIAGSRDVMVYHANSRPPGSGRNELPNYQAAAVTNALNTLHTNAKNDYPTLTLNDSTSLSKPVYNQQAAQLMMMKRGRVEQRQRKLKMDIKKREIDFTGGTTIVGYPGNAGWEFHYQTWGFITYTRPSGIMNVLTGALTFHWNYLHKLRTRGTKEEIVSMRVIDSGAF